MSKTDNVVTLTVPSPDPDEPKILFWAALCAYYGVEFSDGFLWPMPLEVRRALLAAMLEANEPEMAKWLKPKLGKTNGTAITAHLQGMVEKYHPEESTSRAGRPRKLKQRLRSYALLEDAKSADTAGAYHWGSREAAAQILKANEDLIPDNNGDSATTRAEALLKQHNRDLKDTEQRERARQLMLRDNIDAFRQSLDEQEQTWIMRLMERMLEIPEACGDDEQVRALMIYQWQCVAESVLSEEVLKKFIGIVVPVHESKILLGYRFQQSAEDAHAERTSFSKGVGSN